MQEIVCFWQIKHYFLATIQYMCKQKRICPFFRKNDDLQGIVNNFKYNGGARY